MKHIYIAAFAALFSVTLAAQGLLPDADSKSAQARRVESADAIQAVDREVIWSHDCNVDDCGDWVFGNGAGEVGSPWEDIDLNFECSVPKALLDLTTSGQEEQATLVQQAR